MLYIIIVKVVILKKYLLNYCEKIIRKNRNNISDDELEVIMYGLEGIYLTITKLVIIFLLAWLLGIFKEMLLTLIFYNILRVFAFGLHASKSWHCLLISSSFFLLGPFLGMIFDINYYFKIGCVVILIILVMIYAPADTEKRPLINPKKRLKWKILSVIVAVILSVCIIIFDQYKLSNYMFIGYIEAVSMILPITYKLFGLPYNNYKTYK